ncbi:MAG: DUF502 domain-containing protein [Opitutales bacterium]|nr:DUF502 domain-containing protein [Opitutales bacterium]
MKNISQSKKGGFGESLRKAFVTGLLFCLPVSLTIYIIVWLVNFLASPARGGLKYFLHFFGVDLPATPLFNAAVTIVAAFIVAVAIAFIGFVSRNLFGRFFIGLLEKLLHRLPMVRSIYSAIKQIIDTFSVGGKEETFSRAVMVEFPRRDCWTVGFLTHEGETEFSHLAGTALVHVFVPTTPNPTGGYMIFVPANEIKPLDVSVADAMKMIVSGGALIPEEMAEKKVS